MKKSLVFLTVVPMILSAYEYGSLPGFTGAPGDNVTGCIAAGCHIGGVNSGGGSVSIVASGGTKYVPGVAQQIQVTISDATERKYGFQLTVRANTNPRTTQAGHLTPAVDGSTQVLCSDSSLATTSGCATPIGGPLEWIDQTLSGYTKSGTPPSYTYNFSWTPPANSVGPVTFYAAGAAVPGTLTTSGTNVYLGSLQLTPIPVILTSSANPSAFGKNVTLTATAVPLTATGVVRFYDGLNFLGTRALVNGVASLTTNLLAAGTHSLSANYTGDSVNPAGVSATLTEKIAAAPVGGYPTAVSYPAGSQPYGVVIGDFNADGIDDLATANFGSANVSVQLGNGDGTFRPAVNYAVGSNPIAIAAADFNLDGRTDLAVVNNGSNSVSLLFGRGDGTFQTAVKLNVGASPSAVAISDFNGDGNPDMAVTNQGDTSVTVLLGDGIGSFPRGSNFSLTLHSPSSVAVGDFNGDGKLDLVITGFKVLCGPTCLSDNYLAVLPGNGDGTFRTPIGNVGPSCPTNVSCNPAVTIQALPSQAVVGDFNGDGKADVAVADPNVGLTVFLGNGDGTFPSQPIPFAPAAGGPLSVAIGDFNGDGKLDLVVALQQTGNVGIFLGNGDGAFLAQPLYPTGTQPTSVAVGDFNGDAKPDLVTANQESANVSILLGVVPVPPTVVIDAPLSGSSVSGTVTISGWAIDNISFAETAIANVLVSLDGTGLGNATYGISRPDVCSAFPGRPKCPNVGFAFQLSTNGLSPGPHTLTVSATGSDGIPNTGSATITVISTNVLPLVVVDSPLAGSVLSGIATVSGWAIDSGGTAINNVQVAVDGIVVGRATYGLNRSDVCAAYPTSVGCPNVGYTFALDTTGLRVGSHVITVSATDSDGTPDVGSRSVTVTVASLPNVFVEAPTSGAVVSGTTIVTGWAFDNLTPIANVVIKVDGTVIGNATYGLNRPDICVIFPGEPGCPRVGFSFALDTTKLTTGMHSLTAVATDTDSTPDSASWTVPFVVISPPTVYLDTPAGGSTVSGTVTVSGWAIDVATAITGVQIKVDGTVVGAATYGVSRTDVCAAYPGRAGCPNVGFTFQLNTAALSQGPHTITAVATNSNQTPLSGSYTVSVTVGPLFSPPTLLIDSLAPGASVAGSVSVSGWAIDASTPITGVQIKVDGATVDSATYGTFRADVCAAFPGRPGCPNVGFTYLLNTATLSLGTHILSVVATDSDPTPLSSTFSIPIIVTSSLVPPTVVIDSIPAGATVSGTVTVAGWAIDLSSAINNVQVQVDGVTVGTATYGVERTDVCTVYPNRAGCPNVGYTFQLDTSTLNPGNHIIRAVATDNNAVPLSGSFSVTVKK